MSDKIELMKRYLAYLEIDGSQAKDLLFLNHLIKQHVYKIPWENIELFFEGKTTLEPEKLITRYISENRGGLCYQLNITFYHLLQYLGYSVELRLATVFGSLNKTYLKPRNTHIINVIDYEGCKYVADVSWSGIEYLLSIDNSTFEKPFHLKKHGEDPYEFILNYHTGINQNLQYKIMNSALTPAQLNECTDYSIPNEEREAQNRFGFVQKTGANAYISIISDKVKLTHNNTIDEKSIDEYGGLKPALKSLFNVNLIYL